MLPARAGTDRQTGGAEVTLALRYYRETPTLPSLLLYSRSKCSLQGPGQDSRAACLHGPETHAGAPCLRRPSSPEGSAISRGRRRGRLSMQTITASACRAYPIEDDDRVHHGGRGVTAVQQVDLTLLPAVRQRHRVRRAAAGREAERIRHVNTWAGGRTR